MASAVSNLADLASTNNARFNAEAAAWDSRPFVHDASQAACEAILAALGPTPAPTTTTLHTLEIGCGTGILSFLLAPHVQSITAVDAAPGMIDVLKQKLLRPLAPRNILPLAALLVDPDDPALPAAGDSGEGPRRRFDLVTSHLVLHHVPDLEALLRTMHGCLVAGGCVVLTDFEDFGPEARRFHPAGKMDGVARHGINAVEMAGLMRKVGFRDVDVRAKWSMKKTVERYEGEFGDEYGGAARELQRDVGEVMEFPFLVCFGRR